MFLPAKALSSSDSRVLLHPSPAWAATHLLSSSSRPQPHSPPSPSPGSWYTVPIGFW